MTNHETIPVFIINRNLLTWPLAMLKWMDQIPYLQPVIFDNASTYPPLLEWYDTQTKYQVIRMPMNTWHTGVFMSGILDQVKTSHYIVTDPDFDMSHVPLDVVDRMKEGLARYPQYGKCGVAIKIDDMPDEFPGKNEIINWESKYWTDPLGDDFYRAHVDTTFALYDSSRLKHHTFEAIRLAGPYTARHIPWYITEHNISDEFVYYCQHNEGPANVCSYCSNIIIGHLNKDRE